jgi:hypothetical protein
MFEPLDPVLLLIPEGHVEAIHQTGKSLAQGLIGDAENEKSNL